MNRAKRSHYIQTLAVALAILTACGQSSATNQPGATVVTSEPALTAVATADPQESAVTVQPTSVQSNGQGATKQQDTAEFSFTYPANWTLTPLSTAPGEGFILNPPGRQQGTNIVVLRTADRIANVDALQQQMQSEVSAADTSKTQTAGTVSETKRTQVAGHEAVEVRYTAKTRAGTPVQGAQTATLLPSNEAVAVTLSVDTNTDKFEDIVPVYNTVVQSIRIKQSSVTTTALAGSAAMGEQTQAEEYMFTAPAGWKTHRSQPPNAQYASYTLFPPNRTEGTNIIVERIFNSMRSTADLEKQFTGTIQQAHGNVLKTEHIQLSGRDAVLIRYTVPNQKGQQIESLAATTTMPFGAVELGLSVYPGDDFATYQQLFQGVLKSVEIKP